MNQSAVFNPLHYGAVGDGVAKDTRAVQSAIDACAAAGGGMVYLPPGQFLTGALQLRSRVTLHIEAGGVLLGSTDRADYEVVERRYSGTTQLTLEALINGENLEQVTICGRGAIDGQGWWCWQPIRDYYALPKAQRPPQPQTANPTVADVRASIFQRPRLVEPVNCRDLLLEGVTLRNSGFWNLHLLYCEDVRVHNVLFRNPADGCNADGLDIDSCRNVCVANCDFSVGDDCLCLKSGLNEDGRRLGRPTENVVVTNCIMRAGHGGIVIGSDMSGGVRNVAVSNCVFVGTDIGIRMKSMRGRGGVVENINISNIVMENLPEVLVLDMHYWKPMPPEPVSERTPLFRDIRISHIDATRCGAAGYIHGLEELPPTGIRLDGVRIQARKPFWVRQAQGLEFRNVRFECEDGPALRCEQVSDVEIDRLQDRGSAAGTPSLHLVQVQQAYVHDCSLRGHDGQGWRLDNTPVTELRTANNDTQYQ